MSTCTGIWKSYIYYIIYLLYYSYILYMYRSIQCQKNGISAMITSMKSTQMSHSDTVFREKQLYAKYRIGVVNMEE